jgi:hypothetical protein
LAVGIFFQHPTVQQAGGPNMNPEKLISEMEQSTEIIRSLTADFDLEEARFKPTPETWSVLEVVCHLLDEEREDFRQRLDIILHRPGEAWPPIDTAGWVTSRKYLEQDYTEALNDFFVERIKSLAWLKTLENPKWDQEVMAPWDKPIKAGDMFAAWVAHDNLHIRQLVELRRARIEKITQPYGVYYAGDW